MKKWKIICVFLSVFVIDAGALSATKLDVGKFGKVQNIAEKIGKKYGNANVLLVFDMDNTLVVSNNYLGSDPWWHWQDSMLTTNPRSRQLVANNFNDLLRVQGVLYALGHMRLVETNTAEVIANLQRNGFKAVIMTARGYNFRDATERELYANHLNFLLNPLPPMKGYAGSYIPYKFVDLSGLGIDKQFIDKWRIGKARPISYMNGIELTAGQNKGVMLLALLHKTNDQPKAVIFVDDQEQNVDAVFDALQHSKIDIVAIHYTKADSYVKRFDAKEKEKTVRLWHQLTSVIGKLS